MFPSRAKDLDIECESRTQIVYLLIIGGIALIVAGIVALGIVILIVTLSILV